MPLRTSGRQLSHQALRKTHRQRGSCQHECASWNSRRNSGHVDTAARMNLQVVRGLQRRPTANGSSAAGHALSVAFYLGTNSDTPTPTSKLRVATLPYSMKRAPSCARHGWRGLLNHAAAQQTTPTYFSASSSAKNSSMPRQRPA